MPLLDLSGGRHRDRSQRRAVVEGVVADVGEVRGEVDVGEGSAPLEGKVTERGVDAATSSGNLTRARAVQPLKAQELSEVRLA